MCATHPRLQILQPLPEVSELGRRYQYDVELLHNNASELQVLRKN